MAPQRHPAHHHVRPRVGPVLTEQRPTRPPLSVEADLDFSVDVGSGPVRGRIEAAGSTVRVVTDDAVTVWDAATGVPELGEDLVPGLADLLADNGLRMEITGPQGRIASLGDVAPSTVGRLLTGSTRVELGTVGATRPLVIARIRDARHGLIRDARPRLLVAAAIAIAAGAMTAVIVARRR